MSIPARYQLLMRLAEARFPMAIDDPLLIDQLRGYAAAALITCDIPDVIWTGGHRSQPPARVLALTPEGWRTTQRLKKSSTWAT